MGGRLVRGVIGDVSLAQVRYVSPVRFGSATGLVAEVYRAVEREFGVLAPPFTLHSPAPELLAACWSLVRETLVVPGAVSRATKEAVAAAVSVANSCPYCVTVHGAALRDLLPGPYTAAICADRAGTIADPELRAIVEWARDSTRRDDAAGTAAPFPPAYTAELVGVAVAFHYINRMANVFLPEDPLPRAAPARLLGPLTRVLARLMRAATRRVEAPGASLSLLPAAPVPDDASWAAGNPNIAAAFARVIATVESAGHDSVSPPVRELVLSELAVWDGSPKGANRAWTDSALVTLPAPERAAGRLALLTAIASYQVDRALIDEFRSVRPADADLIRLTSWASLAAARRIGAWTFMGDG